MVFEIVKLYVLGPAFAKGLSETESSLQTMTISYRVGSVIV